MAVTLLVTNRNLVVQGDPLAGWTSLEVVRRFNEPSSGSVKLAAHPEVMAQLQPGNRIVVIRDGSIWCAGPLEIPQDYSWGVGEDQDPGTVTCHFSDDLAVIAGRLTYPDATKTAADATQPAERVFSATNAEVIMRTLVNENAGPGALTARQVAQLALDSLTSVGTSMTYRTRFEPLGDALRAVAAKDSLGFRTRQSGTSILFGVYDPTDKTATARFSIGLGNLRSLAFKLTAPTVTSAIVGGGGEGAARVVVEVVNSTAASSWYRVERFVDSRGVTDDTNGELTQAGNEALAEGSAPVELSTVTVDTEDLKAGRDFDLGDLVTVALPTGLEVADIVRSITLTATPREGEVVTSVVGSPESTTEQAMVRTIRELGRRLGRLEAR